MRKAGRLRAHLDRLLLVARSPQLGHLAHRQCNHLHLGRPLLRLPRDLVRLVNRRAQVPQAGVVWASEPNSSNLLKLDLERSARRHNHNSKLVVLLEAPAHSVLLQTNRHLAHLGVIAYISSIFLTY